MSILIVKCSKLFISVHVFLIKKLNCRLSKNINIKYIKFQFLKKYLYLCGYTYITEADGQFDYISCTKPGLEYRLPRQQQDFFPKV